MQTTYDSTCLVRRHFWVSGITLLLLLLQGHLIWAGESTNAIARAERIYKATRTEYEAHPDRLETACAFARACFERTEFPLQDSARAALGKEGIAAARRAIFLQSTNAAAHYYLGLNIGEVARTKRMSALKLVSDMEQEFEIARKLDEKIDYAGPDRCLGLLYRDAPGWPVSVGCHTKARQHLARALDLSPNFPENRINMIETYINWDDTTRAAHDAALLNESWSAAKATFSGEAWEASWNDWNDRREKIQKKLMEKSKPTWHR